MIRAAGSRVGAFMLVGLLAACQPTPSAPPRTQTVKPSVAPTTSPTTRRFEAPGISFDYPIAWVDHTATLGDLPVLGRRHVATFTVGMTPCPFDDTRPGPAGCSSNPQRPGQVYVDVLEFLDVYPSQRIVDADLVHAASPYRSWVVPAADGGYYRVWMSAADTEPESRFGELEAELDALVASIAVTPWVTPPTSTAGLVRQSTPYGFSFEYPTSWARYFPLRDLREFRPDQLLITVASAPVLSPEKFTPSASLPFLAAPGAAVLEFKFETGPRFTDWEDVWADAESSVAGQPAEVDISSGLDAEQVGAHELVTWRIRRPFDLEDPLVIDAWLRGPNIDAARAKTQAVIDSLVMEIPED